MGYRVQVREVLWDTYDGADRWRWVYRVLDESGRDITSDVGQLMNSDTREGAAEYGRAEIAQRERREAARREKQERLARSVWEDA